MNKTRWWQSVKTLRARGAALMADARELVGRVLISGDVQHALAEIDALATLLDHPRAVCALLSQAHPSDEIRRAARELQNEVHELLHGLWSEPALARVLSPDTSDALSDDEVALKRVITSLCHLHGAEQSADVRADIREMRGRMARMGALYRRHMSSPLSSLQLQGDGALRGLQRAWREQYVEEREGAFHVELAGGRARDLMCYADHEETRRKAWRALNGQGWPDNVPVVAHLLEARAEVAMSLGYRDWASLEVAHSLLESKSALWDFIDAVVSAARPAEVRESRWLEDTLGSQAGAPWNRAWARRGIMGDAPPSPFATFERLLTVSWHCLEVLLGWEVEAAQGASIWARGVAVYDVRDAQGAVGRIYVDCAPRSLKGRSVKTMRIETGARGGALPEVALIASHRRGEPLSHSDVVALFHELGHVVEHLVSTRSSMRLLNGLPSDRGVAEVTPQLFELWAWRPELMTALGWGPEAQEALREQERRSRGSRVMRQQLYASYSLAIHEAPLFGEPAFTSFDEAHFERYGFGAQYAERLYAHFPHLVAYGALYGVYSWAGALARDLVLNVEGSEAFTARLRDYIDEVLRRPSSVSFEHALKACLGRPQSHDAYLRWVGEAF